MKGDQGGIPDASAAYRLWDDLVLYGWRLAFSTITGDPEEKENARRRFLRAQERYLKERDAMWARILGRRGEVQRGE